MALWCLLTAATAAELQFGLLEEPHRDGGSPGCFFDNATGSQSYDGGNIFGDKHDVNSTASPEACCALCQQYAGKGCAFWVFTTQGCYGHPAGCCRLKDKTAWAGRKPGGGSVSGSIFPLPNMDKLYLALGDSITWGCGTDAAPRGSLHCYPDAGGYRAPLIWALSQQGFNVTTMGTLATGPSYVPAAWTRHEGHPGWRFDQIDGILNQSLATSPTGKPPDLVTIHLGTNDCGQGLTVPTIQANARKLLAHLHAGAPNADVFMASMIGFPGQAACSASFNALVPGLVSEAKAAGMRITYVPMAETSGVCVDKAKDTPLFPASGLCCAGEVHPTAAGYLRMASSFALSIAEEGLML